jgi:hypothetical protein
MRYQRRRRTLQRKKREQTSTFRMDQSPTTEAASAEAKLTIGKPNDKYEKEADHMAEIVTASNQSQVQKSNANTIGTNGKAQISSIQRMPEEEKAQPMEEEEAQPKLQRMPAEKEEAQPMEGEEAQPMAEKEEAQPMEEEEAQPMEEEEAQPMEEEEAQPKLAGTTGGNRSASPWVSKTVQSSKGKGSQLPSSTKSFMESRFNSDFSNVNIHTDEKAVQMNKEIGAQAFTVGQNIYFNKGKFNPESHSGKKLLAHELTHTVQQKKKSNLKSNG